MDVCVINHSPLAGGIDYNYSASSSVTKSIKFNNTVNGIESRIEYDPYHITPRWIEY